MISIELVLALPERQWQRRMQVPRGCTARQAVMLAAAELAEALALASLQPRQVPLGVYGEPVDDEHGLQDGDRLELYRPLQQDPKALRRQRARERPCP